MKIAVIGAGMIGGRLAERWKETLANHNIVVGVRNPQSPKLANLSPAIEVTSMQLAISNADVVALAIPADSLPEFLELNIQLDDKIVIDTMNAIFRPLPDGKSTSNWIQRYFPHAQVVKAFNCIGAENLDSALYEDIQADMFICGDNDLAKKKVIPMIEALGFRVLDVGGINKEALLESLAALYGALAFGNEQMGRQIAFKVLNR